MAAVGLTSEEARTKLQQVGYNRLPEAKPISSLRVLVRQFESPLIYILLVASGISFFLGDVPDGVIILLATVVNTGLGFYQEWKAEKGLVALKKILSPRAKVIRDGAQTEIEAQLLVPGDVVVIASGDRVPADGAVIEAHSLTVSEAILTGESEPVAKSSQFTVHSSQNSTMNHELITKNSKIFMGTTVVGGIGKFVVTGTGMNTEIGKIAETLAETKEEQTPLQKRFSDVARVLTIVVIVAALFIFTVGMLRQEPLIGMFTTSVAVAVAAIPEGLVIALTAILAIGMQRILKRKALVRKLVVAETLGTVTVIATDKTGTLTEGRLKVVKVDFVDREKALVAIALGNQLLDPLELALWEWLTTQPKFDPEEMLSLHPHRKILPFDAASRFSATLFDHQLCVLGAPEELLERSSLSSEEKRVWLKKVEEWARDGLRLIAVAMREIQNPKSKIQNISHGEIKNLQWLGLVGFADPVRESVAHALSLCTQAGIAVKVVTGDYRLTAEHVLQKVGVVITKPEVEILEGEELEHLEFEELKRRVKDIVLFARVTPIQKLKIVEALKANGEVVGLLGDGVNDAPALKKADIGMVVGEASDVARETADLVLLDSNFSTIVAAVEEGRGIFANIRKVLVYLLSDTFAEVVLIFLGLIFGVPLPLTAAQILWINLVTDTLPTLSLTLEPKERNLLRRPPIDPRLPILSSRTFAFTAGISLIAGIITFITFIFLIATTAQVGTARLVVFTIFSLKSLIYVFSVRDHRHFLWQTHLFSNVWLWVAVMASFSLQLLGLYSPLLQGLLQTRALTGGEWILSLGVALVILIAVEVLKLLRKFLPRSISSR